MATIELQGTTLTCEILRPSSFLNDEQVRLKILLKNAYLNYSEIDRTILLHDMEEWIVAMFRLVAGAYVKEYNLVFENAGLAVDLYPYNGGKQVVSRAERRQNDCVMALRLLMRSADKKSFLGGIYTLLFHKEEIAAFAKALRKEFDDAYPNYAAGEGDYAFVGVSPLGCCGCCYWYLDDSNAVKSGDYVWVTMGRHNTKQIVTVDTVRRFSEKNAPYNPQTVKRVLGLASKEECSNKNE